MVTQAINSMQHEQEGFTGMTQETGTIARQVRRHILRESMQGCVERSTADLVTDALVSASINVRSLSLDDWKALLFDAFQTARTRQG